MIERLKRIWSGTDDLARGIVCSLTFWGILFGGMYGTFYIIAKIATDG